MQLIRRWFCALAARRRQRNAGSRARADVLDNSQQMGASPKYLSTFPVFNPSFNLQASTTPRSPTLGMCVAPSQVLHSAGRREHDVPRRNTARSSDHCWRPELGVESPRGGLVGGTALRIRTRHLGKKTCVLVAASGDATFLRAAPCLPCRSGRRGRRCKSPGGSPSTARTHLQNFIYRNPKSTGAGGHRGSARTQPCAISFWCNRERFETPDRLQTLRCEPLRRPNYSGASSQPAGSALVRIPGGSRGPRQRDRFPVNPRQTGRSASWCRMCWLCLRNRRLVRADCPLAMTPCDWLLEFFDPRASLRHIFVIHGCELILIGLNYE